LTGLAAASAILGAASLKAATLDDHVVWWWGVVLGGAEMSLPGILIRVSVRLNRRLRSGRDLVRFLR